MILYIKTLGLSLAVILFSQNCFAENPEVLVNSQRTKVLISDEYTYYGVDFSKLRLINGEKMDQGELIKNTFCPSWLGEFDADNSKALLQKKLIVSSLVDERYPFQSDQYLKNNSSTIVNLSKSVTGIDSIERVVNDYQLSNKSGIGLSIIISEFNKYDEKVTAYITFFDIDSRELLYVTECYGAATGMGMTNHWYNGLWNAWYEFVYEGFKSDKKKAIKAAKKAEKNKKD